MPTYEYLCVNGHEFERFQRISEPPLTECPECGAEAERQLSAGAGLLFKGSGFYITDYRSESYKQRAKADSAQGAESKSDSKTASKSDSEAPGKSGESGGKSGESDGKSGESGGKSGESGKASGGGTTQGESE